MDKNVVVSLTCLIPVHKACPECACPCHKEKGVKNEQHDAGFDSQKRESGIPAGDKPRNSSGAGKNTKASGSKRPSPNDSRIAHPSQKR